MQAFDFLKLSPSYMASRRITNETRSRRELLIVELADDYRAVSKRVQARIKKVLADAEIQVAKHTLGADLAAIRTTFRFLTGSEAVRANLLAQAENKHPNAQLIKFFEKDGLGDWEKVMAKKAELEQPPAPEPEPPAAPAPSASVELVDPITQFVRCAGQVAEMFRDTQAQLAAEKDANTALRARVEQMESQLGRFDISKVEEIMALAQRMAKLAEEPTKAIPPPPPAPPPSNYPDGPAESEFFAKPVGYSDQFARNVKALDPNSRITLKRTLEMFLKEGFRHPTLKCGKRPGKPEYMNLKFLRMFVIWEDTPKEVKIHWIESSGKPLCK